MKGGSKLNSRTGIVLVAGSSGGIGKAIAEAFLRAGCQTVLSGRRSTVLEEARQELNGKYGKRVHAFCADLTLTENIKGALEYTNLKTGKYPDVVVGNIGTGVSVPGWDVDDAEWSRMVNMNFLGTVYLCRESVRVMKDRGGSIVCISSIAGCEGFKAPLPYSAAKAALLSFVKNCSDSVARYGIRVNAVSPGNVLFDGGTWSEKLKDNRDEVLDRIEKTVPLGGFATPQDIAEAVVFLASKQARFITGANIVVDGGQVRKYL